MPRKKQNIEAYGKSWSPVDLPNLEKAIKLFERLDYIASHFADSLSGSNAIWSQINEKADIQNELQKLGIKLTEEQAKEVVNLLKQRQQENEVTKNTNKSNSQNTYSLKDSVNNIRSRSGIKGLSNFNIDTNNIGSNILSGVQFRKNYNYFSQNSISKNPNTITKLAENKTINDIKGSASKFNLAAGAIQVAANTFKKGVDTFKNLFTTGLEKQKQAYENTFTNISVRNGTTRSEYYGAQSKTNNILSDLGLRDNIATSDVQTMWNTLASEGIKIDLTDQNTTVQAIETILTNQIVPYLDMSSAYMQKLTKDNPTLMKQVRGIGAAVQSVEDSNVVANDYLQDMLTNLSPMAQLANQEIGVQYADTLGQLENLRNQGYSDSQIGELYSTIKTMVEDPYKAITTGDTMQKITTADMLGSNEDLHDSSAWLRKYTKNITSMANIAPEGNQSSLYAGLLHYSMGGPSTGFWDTTNIKNINADESSNAGYQAKNKVNTKAEETTSAFTSGKNQTNATLQNITAENLANELAVGEEWMGHWTDIIVTAIKGVGTLILTSVIGKGISALAGLAGGGTLSTSSGLGAILGSTGPIALGVGSVAAGVVAGVAVSKAIRDKINSKAEEKNESSKAVSDMKAKGLAEDLGISEGEASLNLAGSNIYNHEKNWLGTTFDAYDAADLFGAKLGLWDTLDEKDFVQTMDSATKKADPLEYNKAKIGRSLLYKGLGTGSETLSSVAKAWMIGLYSQGYQGNNESVYKALADTLNIGSFTPDIDSISALLKNDHYAKSQFNSIVNYMKDADMWLWNAAGKWIMPSEADYEKAIKDSDLSSEDKEWLNSHRQGLNEVPYDDYPALLHQGEAVLTASTTNELRNLIDTYRETNNESVNYDAIIQGQTNQLLDKMDQIITAINSNQLSSTTNSTSKVSDNIFDSMVHIRNTRTI